MESPLLVRGFFFRFSLTLLGLTQLGYLSEKLLLGKMSIGWPASLEERKHGIL